MFRLCRFLSAGWRWNFDDHRIILEKPLLNILPLGGWDHARPPGKEGEGWGRGVNRTGGVNRESEGSLYLKEGGEPGLSEVAEQ